MKSLVIEDDADIAEIIRISLVENHYGVDIAMSGDVGYEMAWSNDYDLIILDVMLPKMNGKDLCRQLRRDGMMTPILMLTALATDGDVIEGLDLGADDYLTKPFSIAVLLARVRALTRRPTEQRSAEIRVADLVIDTVRRTVRRDGRRIMLSAKEFTLLEYFALNREKILTHRMISEHVWDSNFDPHSNVIESLVKCLRQKIDRDFPLQLIQTVRGAGYRFGDRED